MQTAPANLAYIRHSFAHVLASAVLKFFPDAKLGVGPVIENGCYYDFLLPRPLTPEDLKNIGEISNMDIVVNATSVGMNEDKSPIDKKFLNKNL